MTSVAVICLVTPVPLKATWGVLWPGSGHEPGSSWPLTPSDSTIWVHHVGLWMEHGGFLTYRPREWSQLETPEENLVILAGQHG